MLIFEMQLVMYLLQIKSMIMIHWKGVYDVETIKIYNYDSPIEQFMSFKLLLETIYHNGMRNFHWLINAY